MGPMTFASSSLLFSLDFDDDAATLEEALDFIDECSSSGSDGYSPGPSNSGSSSDNSSTGSPPWDVGLSAGSMPCSTGDINDTVTLASKNEQPWHERRLARRGRPYRDNTAGRRRRTPAQELKALRTQIQELSTQLENLQLNVRNTVISTACIRRNSSLAFWSNAATRQNEYRLQSERENERLRALVAAQTRQTKQLQRVIRKLTGPTELRRTMTQEEKFISTGTPLDTAAVIAGLMKQVEELYPAVDNFMLQSQDKNQASACFFEYSNAEIVPFARGVVDRAVWRGIGYRVTRRSTFYRDFVEVTDSTISTCAHVSIRQPNGNTLYLQTRLAGKEYREEDRTVYVLRAQVEPVDAATNSPIGPSFQETHVRVVAQSGTVEGPHDLSDASSAITTRVEVCHNLGPSWDDSPARRMWLQTVEARKLIIEDLLLEESRNMPYQP